MGISFFKIPKHRTFNYQPRYYDSKKEAMQERLKKYGDSTLPTEIEPERYHPGRNIKGNIRNNLYTSRRGLKHPLLGRIIVLICILLLVVMVYLFAKSIGVLFT